MQYASNILLKLSRLEVGKVYNIGDSVLASEIERSW